MSTVSRAIPAKPEPSTARSSRRSVLPGRRDHDEFTALELAFFAAGERLEQEWELSAAAVDA